MRLWLLSRCVDILALPQDPVDIQTRDSGGSSRRGPSRLLSPHLADWTPLRGENGDELAIDVVPSEKNDTRVLAKQRGLMA